LELADKLVKTEGGKPGPPRTLKINTADWDSVQLEWIPPLDDGGTDITRYDVELRPLPDQSTAGWSGVPEQHDFKPFQAVEDGSTATALTNLRAQWEYEVRVRAVSGIGKGEFAVLGGIRATGQPSEAPQGLNVQPGPPGTLMVRWEPPTTDGGFDVSKYDVFVRKTDLSGKRRSGPMWDQQPTDNLIKRGWDFLLPCEFRAGIKCRFKVRAMTALGPGAFAEAEEDVEVQGAAPEAPTEVTALAVGLPLIRLTWLPASDGGADILSYEVQQQADLSALEDVPLHPPTTAWVAVDIVKDLTKPVELDSTRSEVHVAVTGSWANAFRVRASNHYGAGEWSEPSASVLTTPADHSLMPEAALMLMNSLSSAHTQGPEIRVTCRMKEEWGSGFAECIGFPAVDATNRFDGNVVPTHVLSTHPNKTQPLRMLLLSVSLAKDGVETSVPHSAIERVYLGSSIADSKYDPYLETARRNLVVSAMQPPASLRMLEIVRGGDELVLEWRELEQDRVPELSSIDPPTLLPMMLWVRLAPHEAATPVPILAPIMKAPSEHLREAKALAHTGKKMYRLQFHTAAERLTTASISDVSLVLYGHLRVAGPLPLVIHSSDPTSPQKIDEGQMDEFDMEIMDVGALQKMRVGITGDAAWSLESVTVRELSNGGRTWSFVCDHAIRPMVQSPSAQQPQGFSAFIDLYPDMTLQEQMVASSEALKPYLVKVFTGSVALSGTDANVTIEVHGSGTNKCEVVQLRNDGNFGRGRTAKVTLMLPNLGHLRFVRIHHDGSYLEASRWYLEKVEIYDELIDTTWEFPCARWIPQSETADPAIELFPVKTDAEDAYAVRQHYGWRDAMRLPRTQLYASVPVVKNDSTAEEMKEPTSQSSQGFMGREA
jgi:hypothetical protein